MKESNCIICGKDITKTNWKIRCYKCYCNSDNDKIAQEYGKKV